MTDEEPDRRFIVSIADEFEIDYDVAYLYLTRVSGPLYAAEWDKGLTLAIQSIPEFPGPRANAIDDEGIRVLGYREVRRILYYGPNKRRPMRIPYRVLYTIIEPEDSPEGYIRVLRLVHGSRPLILPEG